MDFSEILDNWENRNHRRDQEPYDKDQAADPGLALPARPVMERAPVQDELDLHGLTQHEALNSLRTFLRESRLEGLRKVLVIHGKGLHSESGRAVLREAVRQAVGKDRNVAAWGEADRHKGGAGAVWVWLSARGK